MAGPGIVRRPPALRWPVDEAYRWLCRQRRHFPANADVWHLRFHWRWERTRLLGELRAGTYRFAPVQPCRSADGEAIHLWSARDALVLKALSWMLAPQLAISPRCTHTKGHGGHKATVAEVQRRLPQFRFVLRTDVKDYYASLDHEWLLVQLARRIQDRFVINLLVQYLRRSVDCGGNYREVRRGIARGCALSPLIGAFYLKVLDEALHRHGLYYLRYMDDIVVLAPTRWRLRGAVRVLQQVFTDLKLAMHPDKTFIGRIERGFDFLGYRYSRGPLRLAAQTVRHFGERLLRLYEQQRTAPEGAVRLGDYVTRWLRWTQAGLGESDRGGLLAASGAETQQAGKT